MCLTLHTDVSFMMMYESLSRGKINVIGIVSRLWLSLQTGYVFTTFQPSEINRSVKKGSLGWHHKMGGSLNGGTPKWTVYNGTS